MLSYPKWRPILLFKDWKSQFLLKIPLKYSKSILMLKRHYEVKTPISQLQFQRKIFPDKILQTDGVILQRNKKNLFAYGAFPKIHFCDSISFEMGWWGKCPKIFFAACRGEVNTRKKSLTNVRILNDGDEETGRSYHTPDL